MLLRIKKIAEIAEYHSFLEDFVDILKVCSDSKGTVTGSYPPPPFCLDAYWSDPKPKYTATYMFIPS
jgi:hypothetical protein